MSLATMSKTLLISTLLTMCGVAIQWLTRSLIFWPGYLHLSPRDDTRIFGSVELTRWETGFYKLRNIGIGWVVFAGVNLVAQPCFATGVRELVRPLSGKEEDS